MIALLGQEHRGRVVAYFCLAMAYAVLQGIAMSLIVPISRALFDREFLTASRWLAALGVLVVVASALYFRQSMAAFDTALLAMRVMHRRLGDHLSRLPIAWFGGDRVGSVSQMSVRGTFFVGGAIASLVTPVVVNGLSAVTVVIVVAFFDLWLAAVLAVGGILIIAVGLWSSAVIAGAEEATHQTGVQVDARLVEVAQCQQVLRSCGASGRRYGALDDVLTRQADGAKRAYARTAVGFVLNGITVQFVLTVAIAVGAWLALTGRVEAASAVTVVALAARFTGPLAELAGYGSAIRGAHLQLDRINEVLTTEPMPEPAESADQPSPGEIAFESVQFGYTAEKRVLDGISFTVASRTTTAIVGPSGSGKSTICRLIARFDDVSGGRVLVGGSDVRELTTQDLMDSISIVFQDVYLFDDTLWGNIAVGRPDARNDEIERAAVLSGVDEIAARLSLGYQTPVGEGGSMLSGGERQRVSIARALVKQSPIVLLDEATSALDTENEAFIVEGITELARERTVVVVAHSVSTVRHADQIVVLGRDGTIAQVGTHENLVAEVGPYRDFVTGCQQSAGWRMANR